MIASDRIFVERTARCCREAVPLVAADILLYTPGEFEYMKEAAVEAVSLAAEAVNTVVVIITG